MNLERSFFEQTRYTILNLGVINRCHASFFKLSTPTKPLETMLNNGFLQYQIKIVIFEDIKHDSSIVSMSVVSEECYQKIIKISA